MQEVLTDGAGCFHLEAVLRRQSIHTDHLDDLVQGILILKEGHQLLACAHPVRSDVLIEPRADGVEIQTVGCQPVDCREVSLMRKVSVKTPENFDDSKCRLGDRLGNITARR